MNKALFSNLSMIVILTIGLGFTVSCAKQKKSEIPPLKRFYLDNTTRIVELEQENRRVEEELISIYILLEQQALNIRNNIKEIEKLNIPKEHSILIKPKPKQPYKCPKHKLRCR